ncbi:unnamed protein product [Hyaloperonospora brassicae]|uniref:FH2 domain-containing protein n=1 Tax=Hyaloperonospora brassicae TaxID=162125 RepID=A0AAV0UJJ7_HYABA|nr:unnamed protein product [Hyaloperonospora brassicae]
MDSTSCHAASTSSEYWLLFHLLVSFTLVANVRWSRVVVHAHACRRRDLPVCCARQPQVTQCPTNMTTQSSDEKKLNIVENSSECRAKDDELQVPTLVVSPETTSAATRLDSLRVEYATYLQMLKVGLPRAIVEHKLRAENKDPKVLDELIHSTTPRVKKVPAPIQIPPMDDLLDTIGLKHRQKVESFRRMLQVGVPRLVVEMKARTEGVDAADLDTPCRAKPGVAVVKCVEDDRLLTHAELATRSRRSSVSSIVSTAPSTPDALAARSASSAVSSTGRELALLALRKLNNGTRKKLHWSTTPYTDSAVGAQRQCSLWSQIHEKKTPRDGGVCISSESRRWMETLFVKGVVEAKAVRRQSAAAGGQEGAMFEELPLAQYVEEVEKRERANSDPTDSNGGDDEVRDDIESEPTTDEGVCESNKIRGPRRAFLRRKMCVVLLDHKKSQNIAIVLARVKRTFPELAHQILTLTCDVLSSPALQSLIDMWPDSTEQEAIDRFDGDVSSLATAEQFLMVARSVPRAQQKLRCLQYKMDFTLRVEELRDSLKLLTRGIQQVCSSDQFAGVLEYIFHLGNLLNFGEGVEYTRWVKSITISSLAKLSFTKAYDGRISFLQYVIQSIERDEPHLALFSHQLSLITTCSKLSVQSLVAEYQSLKEGLRQFVHETQTMAVVQTDDDNVRTELTASRKTMRLYADEAEHMLNGVRELIDQLERERLNFLHYFEEEDTLPVDELLGYIANFTQEYTRERQQLILRARETQQVTHLRSASVHNLSQIRHSL